MAVVRCVIIGVKGVECDPQYLLLGTFNITNFSLAPVPILAANIENRSSGVQLRPSFGEVTSRDGRLTSTEFNVFDKSKGWSYRYLTVAVAVVCTCKVDYLSICT